jgi:predicted N-acetyltransferase YhbS
MQIRNINWPADRDKIAEHIRLVHGPGDSDFLMQWYGSFPDFNPADCFVIDSEDGQIAAHTMLIPRAFRIGEAVIPGSEVGVVGVLETHRGKGYATALMERAIQRMTERGDVLGLILGIPNFYERWQYEYAVGLYLTSYESEISTEDALGAKNWNLQHSHHRRTMAYLGITRDDVMIRRCYNSDLTGVMALYNREAARGHYLIARDIETWDWQLRFLTDIGRYDKDDFLVAERDNELVGYVRVVSNGQINWFREKEAARFSIVESAGSDPDATEALLNGVAQLARDYNADRIGVFIHPDSQMMRHILAHGGTRRDFTGAGFMRLHDLAGLITLLKPTFEARLAESRFNTRGFHFHVTTGDAQAEVTLGYGTEHVMLEAPAVDLLRLATGWFTIDDVPAHYYSEPHKDLLRVLFPKREPRISMADIL